MNLRPSPPNPLPLAGEGSGRLHTEVISHQLLLRAGPIRKLAAGVHIGLGLRVLRQGEAAVREEMNRAGALELLMPAVQPAEPLSEYL